MKKSAWAVIALLLVATGLFLLGRKPAGPAIPPPPPNPAVVVQDGLTVVGGTGFDQAYLSPQGTAQDDLKLVAELLDAAVLLVKDLDRFPLPDNADFTAFLQGKNPHHVAWIRPGHPAVSAQGELLDRWGSPLFFHKESSRQTALRSAGPDRTLWTDDDVIWPAE